jgi:hypothetical protein
MILPCYNPWGKKLLRRYQMHLEREGLQVVHTYHLQQKREIIQQKLGSYDKGY